MLGYERTKEGDAIPWRLVGVSFLSVGESSCWCLRLREHIWVGKA